MVVEVAHQGIGSWNSRFAVLHPIASNAIADRVDSIRAHSLGAHGPTLLESTQSRAGHASANHNHLANLKFVDLSSIVRIVIHSLGWPAEH